MARLGRSQPFPWKQRPVRIAVGSVTVTPTTGTLTLTGYALTVSTPRVVTPSTATLTLTGYGPTVATPVVVVPATATLVLTGYVPTVIATSTTTPTPTVVFTGVPTPLRRRRRTVVDGAGRGLVIVTGIGVIQPVERPTGIPAETLAMLDDIVALAMLGLWPIAVGALDDLPAPAFDGVRQAISVAAAAAHDGNALAFVALVADEVDRARTTTAAGGL